MPKHEFGILDMSHKFDIQEYYEPDKYNCISIDDDFILPILTELKVIDTFYHNTSQPERGLDYYGITLIPPTSLHMLKKILSTQNVEDYQELIEIIDKAVIENKFIIHFGI